MAGLVMKVQKMGHKKGMAQLPEYDNPHKCIKILQNCKAIPKDKSIVPCKTKRLSITHNGTNGSYCHIYGLILSFSAENWWLKMVL